MLSIVQIREITQIAKTSRNRLQRP